MSTKYIFRYQDGDHDVEIHPNFGPWDSVSVALYALHTELGCRDPDDVGYYLCTVAGGKVSYLNELVRLTVELDKLDNQSDEAEDLRGEMDVVWYRLTEDEIENVNHNLSTLVAAYKEQGGASSKA